MLHALNTWAGTAFAERATLAVNHVLGAEPSAMDRLRPHAGRCIQLQLDHWPALLPAPPVLTFRVTPAGLIEWCGSEPNADPAEPPLRVTLDASNPAGSIAHALGGTRPQIDIAGDAAFASDLNWLIDNLRWDVEDDLARALGPAPARAIARTAGGGAGALREAARVFGARATRDRQAPPPSPPQ
jgi:ubiquinone biosynthesis protein UbiJ